MGDFKQAIIHYKEGIRIYKRHFGIEHITTVQMMEDLARAYNGLGDHDAALMLYLDVLKIKMGVITDRADIADTMRDMALTFQMLGCHDLAMGLFRRTLTIYQRDHALDAGREANTLKNIGITYSERGDYAKAADFFKRALIIENIEYGLDDPNIANTFNNLGVALGRAGKHREAIRLFQMALHITERFRAPGHVDIADMHHNIAIMHLVPSHGQVVTAREHLTESHRVFSAALGDKHPKSRRAKRLLDSLPNGIAKKIKEKGKTRNKHKHRSRRMHRR